MEVGSAGEGVGRGSFDKKLAIVRPANPSLPRVAIVRPRIANVLLGWLAMLAIDLLLHAGLLAPLYSWQGAFLLRPQDAFLRIPVGYGGHPLLGVLLAWLLARLDVRGAREGAFVAGAFGGVVWAALVLGLWSISTAEPRLLVGWWAGQTIEMAVGGAVIGSLLAGTRVRAVAWRVAVLAVLGLLAVALLQASGYAQAPILIH